MHKLYATFILILLLAGTWPAFTQNEEIRVHNYGFEEGLSHRNVFKVQQDHNGYLWIATAKGINRFDGHSFLSWTSDKDDLYLPADQIHDILIDEEDHIWLANGKSLSLFYPENNEIDTIRVSGSAHAGQRHNNLCIDGTGKIWCTTYTPEDSTIWLQRANEMGQLINITQLPGYYSGRPIARIGGLIYVGAFENELWVYNLDGTQIEQFEFPAPRNDKPFSRIIQLTAGKDGTIWALLAHGEIYFLPPKGKSFIRHPMSDQAPSNLNASCFYISEDGNIWMGGIIMAREASDNEPCASTRPGPFLSHFHAITGKTEDHSYHLAQVLPYGEAPRQIFVDRTGVVWICSPFGLIKIVENDLFESYMSDGNDCCRDGKCSMRGITEDDEGNIYFSYYNSLHILNPRNGSLTPLFSQQLGTPYGICYEKGGIWTGEGCRIDLQTLKIDTLISGFTGSEGVVTQGGDGKLWFGNQHQLIRLDPETYEKTNHSDQLAQLDPEDPIQITFICPGGNPSHLWLGTLAHGVIRMTTDGEVLQQVQTPELPDNRILAIHENSRGLWIATASGLVRLDDEDIQIYTTEDGLPNNFINGILPEGDSAIWISTDNGLSRLDLRKQSFSNFFDTDGLTKNEFNRISFFQASDGRMYFGGINGINAFYPNAQYGKRQERIRGKMLFTRFSKFDGVKDLQLNTGLSNHKPIELSHREEMFTFHFALSEFSDPKIHQYSYMLEGYSPGWSEPSGVNFARYFNIPAGKYTFRARASRGGSGWIEDELAVPVIIRQAFYKQTWFQMLVFGVLTLTIFSILRYRLYLSRKHEHELEALVQERTLQLETEKRKSDELLLNILPAETAEELKLYGSAKAKLFDRVTVLFSDFKGFSYIASEMEPEALVAEIDFCFRAFDEIIDEFGLEKIKTVGDAYLCGGGFGNEQDEEEAVRVIKAGLKIQHFLENLARERAKTGRPSFRARIGVHTGAVVGGIVGIKKFAYDIWGDTVNISERLQSNGEVGKVNISKSTYELIKDHFQCTYRGKVPAKHQGEIDMYFVEE